MERTDVPICQDPSEPEIPYKMDVCNVYAVFNDPTDRFISVGSTSARTDDPNGFFQHSLGADTAPACNLIPLFPALVCDSYVTVANACSGSGDGSTRDPAFASTALNTSGPVAGRAHGLGGQAAARTPCAGAPEGSSASSPLACQHLRRSFPRWRQR